MKISKYIRKKINLQAQCFASAASVADSFGVTSKFCQRERREKIKCRDFSLKAFQWRGSLWETLFSKPFLENTLTLWLVFHCSDSIACSTVSAPAGWSRTNDSHSRPVEPSGLCVRPTARRCIRRSQTRPMRRYLASSGRSPSHRRPSPRWPCPAASRCPSASCGRRSAHCSSPRPDRSDSDCYCCCSNCRCRLSARHPCSSTHSSRTNRASACAAYWRMQNPERCLSSSWSAGGGDPVKAKWWEIERLMVERSKIQRFEVEGFMIQKVTHQKIKNQNGFGPKGWISKGRENDRRYSSRS